MKIELSDQQEQQVKQGCTVEVLDPVTQQAFVLLAREQYERVRHLLEQGIKPSLEEPSTAIPPNLLCSQQAFWRELPELLSNKRNHGKWVCYHGKERIGIGKTQAELYQECFRRGLQRGEFYVGKIKEAQTPPWGTIEADWSLYEQTEGDDDVSRDTV